MYLYDAVHGTFPFTVNYGALSGALTLTTTGVQFGGTIQSGSSTGVSCSGAPTASYAVTNGIVTHC